MHVKGHSVDGGYDKADERVQLGKEEGPYARLRDGGGEGASRYGAAVRAALSSEEPYRRDRWWAGEGGLAPLTRRSKCSRTWSATQLELCTRKKCVSNCVILEIHTLTIIIIIIVIIITLGVYLSVGHLL